MPTDLTQLRPGNIIVVYPRENQQGILSILEIQKSSVLCRMLVPREGYLFRIQFHEINSLKLDKEWLEKASFVQDPQDSGNWFYTNKRDQYQFTISSGSFNQALKNRINYMHELQNVYFELTGTELTITIS
ncbi:hypothetical protein [Arcticibacter eurypsychrophilus]|uniref:hypothetical protein n=1 Tax=Arcticibacter eurypsychrophilus TaxID=1434752 RepID=UPI00084D9026|nr:hypothetical protein [Arcticibacter eurypsychrophilus]